MRLINLKLNRNSSAKVNVEKFRSVKQKLKRRLQAEGVG